MDVEMKVVNALPHVYFVKPSIVENLKYSILFFRKVKLETFDKKSKQPIFKDCVASLRDTAPARKSEWQKTGSHNSCWECDELTLALHHWVTRLKSVHKLKINTNRNMNMFLMHQFTAFICQCQSS